MSKIKAFFQIVLGLFLSSIGFPSQSKILVYLCEQEASLGWLSQDVCLLSKFIFLILGFVTLAIGIINLLIPEKKKVQKK